MPRCATAETLKAGHFRAKARPTDPEEASALWLTEGRVSNVVGSGLWTHSSCTLELQPRHPEVENPGSHAWSPNKQSPGWQTHGDRQCPGAR